MLLSKDDVLVLTYPEVTHLVSTLENCYEEFEELMRDREWFVTEVVDRIQTCLEILDKQPNV
jgi:hypothetical protein